MAKQTTTTRIYFYYNLPWLQCFFFNKRVITFKLDYWLPGTTTGASRVRQLNFLSINKSNNFEGGKMADVSIVFSFLFFQLSN